MSSSARNSPAPGVPGPSRLRLALLRPPWPLRMAGAAGALLLAASVLGLGAQPAAVGVVGAGLDKLAHGALHFVLAWLMLLALGLRRGAWALAGCAAFAVLDEWAQQFNPGRSISAGDVVASIVGAVLALASAQAVAQARDWAATLRAARRRARLQALIARWLQAQRR